MTVDGIEDPVREGVHNMYSTAQDDISAFSPNTGA